MFIEDIDRTHGLSGKKPNWKSRPVTVKFVRYNTRDLIYKIKKDLKGLLISITEDLTVEKIKILQKAREEHAFQKFGYKMEGLCIGMQ